VPLTDAQRAATGAPWRPVEEHARRGALDLTVAQFDESTGANWPRRRAAGMHEA
jgi:hypothetical protein